MLKTSMYMSWLAIYQKSKEHLGTYSLQVICIHATKVREMYEEQIGAHVKQIPHGLLPHALMNHDAWRTLGMTPSSYSWELLGFAYQAQCRCDPLRTPLYFTQLCQIIRMLANVGEASPELQQLIHDERKRHRYTFDDLRDSIALLGFGKDGVLGVEFDGQVDDKFILDAWRDARRQTWTDPVKGGEMRMRLNDALKIIADARNSQTLDSAWDRGKGIMMSLETAYATLEVPKYETTLLAIYTIRVENHSSQRDKMNEALSVIAEVTNSDRLRKFMETGKDPGDATDNSSSGMARG